MTEDRKESRPVTYAEARRGSANKSLCSIVSVYSATFGLIFLLFLVLTCCRPHNSER